MEPQQNPEEITSVEAHTAPETTPNKKPGISLAAAIITSAAMIAVALIIIMRPTTTPAKNPTADTTRPSTPATIPADIATVRPSDTDHVRGDLTTAQVLIFEYSDSDCPYCEKFHPVLQQVVNDYKGKVAWVYRFYPLSIHPDSFNESLALQCVGQIGGAKAFNTYLDTIINVTLTPGQQSDKLLATMATSQGIDQTKFKACIASSAATKAVQDGIDEAQAIGAQGTPFSILVNVKTGKQIIIPGSYPIADVKKDIDSLLQ